MMYSIRPLLITLLTICFLSSCSSGFYAPVLPTPMLAAPQKKGAAGFQRALTTNIPTTQGLSSFSIAFNGQGYYAFHKHLFIESATAIGNSPIGNFNVRSISTAPGLGYYAKTGRIHWIFSTGLAVKYELLTTGGKIERQEHKLDPYQQIGFRLYIGQKAAFQLFAGAHIYENIAYRTKYNNLRYNSSTLTDLATATRRGRYTNIVVFPFAGVSYGKPNRVSFFAQMVIGVYDFYKGENYGNADLLNVSLGIRLPITSKPHDGQ